MRPLLPFTLAALALAALPAQAAEPTPFAADLDAPVDLAFGPDGRLYYAELATGFVRALGENGKPSEPVLRVESVAGGNGGFTGLAVAEDGTFFLHYSREEAGAPHDRVNRVSRWANGTETVLVDDLPWAPLHVGGRVAVGADGLVYATTGDNDARDPAQDEASVLGKVLRMTRDGNGAPGNPEGWHPLAWARGFRNPFGIDVRPDGRVFVSDNGGIEEVNLVRAGENHGWPRCTGPCGAGDVTDPIASWREHFGPTGVAVHEGTLYLADYARSRVHAVDLATGATSVLWAPGRGGLLDVAVGPDSCLYVSGMSDVWRMPLAGGAECRVADAPAPDPPTPAPPSPSPPPPSAPTPQFDAPDPVQESRRLPGAGAAAAALAAAVLALARRRA